MTEQHKGFKGITMFYDAMNEICEKYDLIGRTLDGARKYIQMVKQELPEEYAEWMEIAEIREGDFAEAADFRVVNRGYRINSYAGEDAEVYFVVVDVCVKDEFVCKYYRFYDMDGDVADEFVDW